MHPLRRSFLLAAAAAVALPMPAAHADSFMLAPGAPTAAELSRRIASLEAEIAGRLTGAAREDFERERRALLRREGPPIAAGSPESEIRVYGRLERRWMDLDARARALRGTGPGAQPLPAPAPPER